jgi:hypothetical protein
MLPSFRPTPASLFRVDARRVEARRRSAKRARSGGAVMFIVAMTIALIAAMGVYALNIAATEVKTAGYLRQNVQTHYLSEYGVLTAAERFAGGGAYDIVNRATNIPDTICPSLPGIVLPTTPKSLATGCWRVGSAELAQLWTTAPVAPITLWLSNANEVSRGSVGLPTVPDFYVEFTDAYQTTDPGICNGTSNDPNNPVYCYTMTALAVGISKPPAAWITGPAAYAQQGQESARVRLSGGPGKKVTIR